MTNLPTPPYPAGTLSPPLSPTERNNIINYLATVMVHAFALDPTDFNTPSLASAIGEITGSGWDDGTYIEAYNNTVNSGTYENYVAGAQKDRSKGLPGNLPGQPPIGNIVGGIEGAYHGITSVVDFLSKLADPHNWVRAGEFAVGFLLIGVAVNAALKGNNTYDRAAGTVRTGSKKVGLLTPSARAARDNAQYEATLRRGTQRMRLENSYRGQQLTARSNSIRSSELKARDLQVNKRLVRLIEVPK